MHAPPPVLFFRRPYIRGALGTKVLYKGPSPIHAPRCRPGVSKQNVRPAPYGERTASAETGPTDRRDRIAYRATDDSRPSHLHYRRPGRGLARGGQGADG